MNSPTSLSRRDAIIGLVALFGGGVLASPSTAAATTGAMQYGTSMNSGADVTTLVGAADGPTFLVENTNGVAVNSRAILAFNTAAANSQSVVMGINGGLGPAIEGRVGSPVSSSAPALLGRSSSKGPGVRGVAEDLASGAGVEGLVENGSNSAPAVFGSTSGSGPGVMGETTDSANPSAAVQGSSSGIGPAVGGLANGAGSALSGVLANPDSVAPAMMLHNAGHGYGLQINAMNNAQIRIVPSTVTGPPSDGAHYLGDLFMDAAGVLYRCAVTGTPGTWVPVGSNVPVSAMAQAGARALSVDGVASFSRAGRGSIAKRKSSSTVAVPSGLSASSLILVTLQNSPGNVLVKYAARVDGTHFKVVLSKAPTATTYFSWFVVG